MSEISRSSLDVHLIRSQRGAQAKPYSLSLSPDDYHHYLPKPKRLRSTQLMKLLGSSYDPFWMSVEEPQEKNASLEGLNTLSWDLVERRTQLQKELFQETEGLDLSELLVSHNLSRTIIRHFQQWLVETATCHLTSSWVDMGTIFWPRWVRHTYCDLGDGHPHQTLGVALLEKQGPVSGSWQAPSTMQLETNPVSCGRCVQVFLLRGKQTICWRRRRDSPMQGKEHNSSLRRIVSHDKTQVTHECCWFSCTSLNLQQPTQYECRKSEWPADQEDIPSILKISSLHGTQYPISQFTVLHLMGPRYCLRTGASKHTDIQNCFSGNPWAPARSWKLQRLLPEWPHSPSAYALLYALFQ
ncbi:hypothetical protein JRQ81_016280 [Phrynocephalus forsythii]|uniref:Uncharacterized protein n=1 Tax=Phrynocephalus forsythii TaxID=171643 RepID=A0A9Q0XYV7_9SAUR|nr:hypothetical protein JRQ81_016280 [Phrynocephalus forsythii]